VTTGSTEVAALQAVLAGEHAALYGYGVVGARLRGRRRAEATEAYADHRARRDEVHALLVERGAEPVPAAAGYRLPAPVDDPGDAVVLAAGIEERLVVLWLDAVADLRGELRERAARAVQDTAVRAAGWRGTGEPFPGLVGPG
jgi:hypothetical protein